MQEIEFLYDFSSPNAYFVHKVLPKIAARHGAKVIWRPVLLGGIFKATNNQPPMMAFSNVTGKVDYMRLEIKRFLERYEMPFRMNPHFPVNSLALMRGAVFAREKPWESRYIDACFDAMWIAGEKMDDPDVIMRILAAADLPADVIMTATQTPDIKGQLAELTDAAVKSGAFGSPTMFVAGEMFFGKDALDDLNWRLETLSA
ncbi:MAG: 2-hydroxychromene-2-carboxylate isomerase [Paracoccaceae bacterium]